MSCEPINWYTKIPPKLRRKYHNPGYKHHGLEVPFRMLVIGSSGAGKTNYLLNLLKITSGTFEKVVICLKSKHEALYEWLEQKLDPNALSFYENEVPDLEDMKQYQSSLIVYDDLVATKSLQASIADAFIRGRKFGISLVYISQSYYGIPKIIRLQSQYIVLKKVGSMRDINLLLREYSFNISKEHLIAMYEAATEKKEDFLLIDLNAENEKKWRHNWTVIRT